MIRKLAVVGVIVTGVLAMTAGTAFAHVEIERDGEVSASGVVNATLSVPNEQVGAGTTSVVLVFPASPKLTSAEAAAVDGWTSEITKDAAGDVKQIRWTGGPLTGGDEIQLPVTIGEVPTDVDTVDFDAVQTYDNGDVVRWIKPTPVGGEEPEHPAPVLTVRGGAPHDDDAAAPTTTARTDSSSDDGMSTVAIVVGVIIVLALIGFLIMRRKKTSSTRVVVQ